MQWKDRMFLRSFKIKTITDFFFYLILIPPLLAQYLLIRLFRMLVAFCYFSKNCIKMLPG